MPRNNSGDAGNSENTDSVKNEINDASVGNTMPRKNSGEESGDSQTTATNLLGRRSLDYTMPRKNSGDASETTEDSVDSVKDEINDASVGNTMPSKNSGEAAGNSETTDSIKDEIDDASVGNNSDDSVKDEILSYSGEDDVSYSGEDDVGNYSEMRCVNSVKDECFHKEIFDSSYEMNSIQDTILSSGATHVLSSEASHGTDEEPEIEAIPLEHVAVGILKNYGWKKGKGIGLSHKEKPDVTPYLPRNIRKFSDKSPPK